PLVPFVSRTFTIAVTDKEMFVIENKFLWVVINWNVQLLFKIIVHPQIVVAHKKVDLNAIVAKFCKFAQSSHKAFWNNGFIFKPKIEKVAEEKNHFGIVLNAVQPFHKNLFE